MNAMGIMSSITTDIDTDIATATPPSTPSATPPATPPDTPPSASLIEINNCSTSISANDYFMDTLLSGIQKYWRRRNIEKMCWCIQEIVNIHGATLGSKESTPLITHLIYRIETMLEEELSFIDLQTYIKAHEIIQDFKKDRTDPVPLFLLAKRVCKARLSHLPTDIYSYFHDYRQDKRIFKPKADPAPSNADDASAPAFDMFKRMLSSKNTECFYWLFQFLDTCEHKERNDLLWKYLEEEGMSISPEITTNFMYRRKTFEQKHIKRVSSIQAVINAVLTLFYRQEVMEYMKDNKLSVILIPDSPPVGKIKLDDYVYDNTCMEGRHKHPEKSFAAKVGNYIVDEDKTFYMEPWRHIYWKRNGVTSEKKTRKKLKASAVALTYTPPKTRSSKQRSSKPMPDTPIKHNIRKSRSRRIKRRKSNLF
jgi:hypothetical protein